MNTRRAYSIRRYKRILVIGFVVMMLMVLFFAGVKAKAGDKATTKYYTSIEVSEGTTLWSVAEEYYTNDYSDYNEYINEVKALNHLGEDTIHSGQNIIIPYYSASLE